MTNDSDMRHESAIGQAWEGDWRARLRARLIALGFTALADFAAAHPQRSIDQLADLLSVEQHRRVNLADVAAIQFADMWLSEAAAAGPAAVEWMARRILVGELAESLPQGFPEWHTAIDEYRRDRSIHSPVWKLTECISALRDCMGETYRLRCERVFENLMQRAERGDVPAGWLPADPDDPILASAFRDGWVDHDQIRGS
jgi:hypothetical protein